MQQENKWRPNQWSLSVVLVTLADEAYDRAISLVILYFSKSYSRLDFMTILDKKTVKK